MAGASIYDSWSILFPLLYNLIYFGAYLEIVFLESTLYSNTTLTQSLFLRKYNVQYMYSYQLYGLWTLVYFFDNRIT